MKQTQSNRKGWKRRDVLKGGAALLAAAATMKSAPLLAAKKGRTLKIGHVSPQTGPLAAFAAADSFVLEQVKAAIGDGIVNNGVLYPIEIISKDSQSNTNRAAEVAAQLILEDEVDLIVAASTPDTTNPVADQAEVNEVPCITTDCPWQPYFFGRNGNPEKGFDWTYHFFWGLEDVIGSFLALWGAGNTNKVVGGLFPNDADGNAWGNPEFGFPPALKKNGFQLVDPGRFQPFSDDFTAQISAFKEAGVEIVTGNLTPPDFATFWTQAAQQGFTPKVVTVGKALLFPSVINSLGERGDGLTTEVWWTPSHPFKSGLTGESAKQLTDAYTKSTGRPWTQPIGFKHALFEVAIDVLKRTSDLDEPEAIRDAIIQTDYQSIVGPVNWSNGPVKNVTKTPLVTGQWTRNGDNYDLVVVNNDQAPNIPVGGDLRMLADANFDLSAKALIA